eukprot:jgi/Botrbrau1/4443/Bobra.0348s0031.1
MIRWPGDNPLQSVREWAENTASIQWSSVAFQLFLLGLAYTVFKILRLFFIWVRREGRLQNIPAGPSQSEALHALASKHIHRVFLTWTRRYGPIFRFRLLHEHVAMITDPTLAAEVLRNLEGADKPEALYKPFSVIASNKGKGNLVTHPTHSKHWQLVRKGIMPAFSLGSLRQQFPGIQKVLARLEAALKQQDGSEPLDITQALGCNTLDIIGIVGFDTDMGGLTRLETGYTGPDPVTLTNAVMVEAF